MAWGLSYDDKNLRRLFAEMDPKKRLKAIKGGYRRAANKVRKTAVKNLRGSLKSSKELERGIHSVVWKRVSGFSVTVNSYKLSKTAKAYYINKKLKRPLLILAEMGSRTRRAKKATRYKIGGRWYTGRSRGYIKRYAFMEKTKKEVRGRVTDIMHNEVINSVRMVAKKYGCT